MDKIMNSQKNQRRKKSQRKTQRLRNKTKTKRLKSRTLRKTKQTKRKTKGGGSLPQLPRGIRFQKGPGRYKYTAILPDGKRVHFGHTSYQHYYDSVPVNLGGGIWSSLNHLDEKRRDNYRKRHSGVLTRSGDRAYKREFSPSWFSYYFLW